MSTPILTAAEVKQYITHTLMAFRQDLEQEMAASGERLALDTRFELYAILYDLVRCFELDPVQQALVCTGPVPLLYDPPDQPLVIIRHDSRDHRQPERIKAGTRERESGHEDS